MEIKDTYVVQFVHSLTLCRVYPKSTIFFWFLILYIYIYNCWELTIYRCFNYIYTHYYAQYIFSPHCSIWVHFCRYLLLFNFHSTNTSNFIFYEPVLFPIVDNFNQVPTRYKMFNYLRWVPTIYSTKRNSIYFYTSFFGI